MHRLVTRGLICAAAAVSLIATAPAAMAAPRANDLPPMTIDFGHTTAGAHPSSSTFGGVGVVKDKSGTTIGRAFFACAEDQVAPVVIDAFCSGGIDITNHGQIALQSYDIMPKTATGTEHTEVAAVTGGTGDYRGATGEAAFVPVSQGVYNVKFR